MNSRIHQLGKMLESEPNDPFLHYALALELASEGVPAKAISILSDLVARDPGYLAAYYQLGKLQEVEGDTENAIVTYRRGIEIARQQKNNKILGELNTALMLLEE